MAITGLATPIRSAKEEPLIIARVEDGFRVYAPSDPRTRFIVSGSPEVPQCTCPLFQERDDPDSSCPHIIAVLNEFTDVEVTATAADSPEAEERQAIQEEGKKPRKARTTATSNGNGGNGNGKDGYDAVLTLKRSVSPDGRINSLSVELTSPVDVDKPDSIQQRAMRLLAAESAIVGIFREASEPNPTERQNDQSRTAAGNGQGNGHGRGNGNGEARRSWPQHRGQASGESAAVPAVVLEVCGMDGKWGRRLFLNVEIDGRVQKLFGSAKELAEHLSGAGFTSNARQIVEGLTVDLPCLATLRPSPDGRFQNVHRLLPEDGNGR